MPATEPTPEGVPPQCAVHVQDCMARLELLENSIATALKRLEDIPTTSTLGLILTYLDAIDKRLATLTPAQVVTSERTDEALRTADTAERAVARLEEQLGGVTDSVGLVLQRMETLEASVDNLGALVSNGHG